MKRLADEYTKNITTIVGLRRHDGPFTFKDYEKYLYGNNQARPSHSPNPHVKLR